MVQATADTSGDDMPYQWYGGLPAGCGAYIERTDILLENLIDDYHRAQLDSAIRNVYVVPEKFVSVDNNTNIYPRRPHSTFLYI